MEFGEKLKELRMQAGLTQAQLAQRIGVTKSVVSFYELRERSPSPDVLMKLSGIFHVSTDYLLGIEKKELLDVSGLTASQITAVLGIGQFRRYPCCEVCPEYFHRNLVLVQVIPLMPLFHLMSFLP